MLYTIQHWQTDPSDFELFSGRFIWYENDRNLRFDRIVTIKDDTFELSEKFFVVTMLNQTTQNMTLDGGAFYEGLVSRYPRYVSNSFRCF